MAKITTQLVHIRMPTAFHRKLMRDADRNGQTLNGEVLRRLEQSYEIGDQLNRAVEKLSEMTTTIQARVQARKDRMQARKEPKATGSSND